MFPLWSQSSIQKKKGGKYFLQNVGCWLQERANALYNIGLNSIDESNSWAYKKLGINSSKTNNIVPSQRTSPLTYVTASEAGTWERVQRCLSCWSLCLIFYEDLLYVRECDSSMLFLPTEFDHIPLNLFYFILRPNAPHHCLCQGAQVCHMSFTIHPLIFFILFSHLCCFMKYLENC